MPTYPDSSPMHVAESLTEGCADQYVVQHPSDVTEEQLHSLLTEAENSVEPMLQWKENKDLLVLEALRHTHNLHDKALTQLYAAFQASVLAQLPDHLKVLVLGCQDFVQFNRTYQTLSQSHRESILDTAKQFCDDYSLSGDFWVQANELDKLNTTRNREIQHYCSVAVSASELDQRLDDLPERLEPAIAILGALASYSMKHAAQLDREAEESQQEVLASSATYKARRRAKAQAQQQA